MKELDATHPEYDLNIKRWEFYLRSYVGGDTYIEGGYLGEYLNESSDQYKRRLELTPLDNHCRNIVHTYSSFLWRVPPTRNFNSLAGNPALELFLGDSNLDGQGLNSFMREAQIWSSVYGHVWLMLDKPASNVGTKAEELQQEIRPYITMFTPENVFDWEWSRSPSGRFQLTYLKVRESVQKVDETNSVSYYRIWTTDKISYYKEASGEWSKVEEIDNALGIIPAVYLPAARSTIRGVGMSDLTDIAYMQKAIYQELSEIEQLIRISNHPTLVKTCDTDASAGAGGIINMPDDLDANLRPFQLQPSGGNLDAIRASITDKVEAINRMAHMGAVRGSQALTMSGVAMQTEFQMLNAKLSEKADILELAEEHLWYLFCLWQEVTPDVDVSYPDGFDIRDYPQELMFLQQVRASGVKSVTLMREVDKQIADLVLDDEMLDTAHKEIDEATNAVGDFSDKTQIYKYHIDAGLVTSNEVREKVGLGELAGGDVLLEPVVETKAVNNGG